MSDTVNVPLDVIQRAVVMAKAIMKAEPLYGCVGYHGDEQINGHVEDAADLACLVLDEMADPVPAPNALAAAPKAECDTCEGRGVVGGFAGAESGYQDDVCPSCQPEDPKVEQEPKTLALWAYFHLTNYSNSAPHERVESIRKVRDAVFEALNSAPAIDELLEALEGLVSMMKHAELDRIFRADYAKTVAVIAKHKGPQS